MTKENVFRAFIEDPILQEREYLSQDQVKKLRITDKTEIKIIEVLKLAINGSIDSESSGVIARKINQYLNK